jgi:peptidase E
MCAGFRWWLLFGGKAANADVLLAHESNDLKRPAQIVAMGGGGFSMEPENLLLDRFILELTGRREPRVCFVPTASGDAQSYIDRFYTSFHTLSCVPSHLSLFKPPPEGVRSFVFSQDVIYVGGGNTRNMLALWREWGLDLILREAWLSGVVMAGLSAGSLCWFQQGVSDSVVPGELAPIECLGFLGGSHCPHYDGEPGRRPAYRKLIGEGRLEPGYAADDGAALHFVGQTMAAVVTSRENARAYSVLTAGSDVVEVELDRKWLGAGRSERLKDESR